MSSRTTHSYESSKEKVNCISLLGSHPWRQRHRIREDTAAHANRNYHLPNESSQSPNGHAKTELFSKQTLILLHGQLRRRTQDLAYTGLT